MSIGPCFVGRIETGKVEAHTSDVHRYLADHRNSFMVEPNSALAALRSASAAAKPQD
jgi:hypothetical protein